MGEFLHGGCVLTLSGNSKTTHGSLPIHGYPVADHFADGAPDSLILDALYEWLRNFYRSDVTILIGEVTWDEGAELLNYVCYLEHPR